MKKMLKEVSMELYHIVESQKVNGVNPNMRGNCSWLRGDCTWLSGDLNLCEITDAERAKGIDIRSLIEEAI